MTIEWRDIKGYEGLYQISNFGEVISLWFRNGTSKRKRNLILKTASDKDGYQHVTLCKNNIKKSCRVHQLVAREFIENPNNLPLINHKDENKKNNKSDNLEWCDVKYNTNYNNATKRRGLSQRIPIVQLSLDMEPIRIWSERVEVEEELAISGSHITNCCLGKNKTAYGYKWRYLRELQQLKEQWGR